MLNFEPLNCLTVGRNPANSNPFPASKNKQKFRKSAWNKTMANHFEFNIRVYIEDTDAGGIVYHANHIRYMERTRTEWLRAAGVSHYWHQTDYNFVVHKINVKYMRPILMDDLITVTARVISCKASSFVLQQNIYRGEIMLASGEVELACISADMKPRRLPDEIRELIHKELEQD